MKLIAHRGNDNHHEKENHFAAFQASLEKDYIAGIELDVRLTKDKKVVISHNQLVNTKDGINALSHMTLKEVRKLTDLDTLEEVLRQLTTNKLIVIEIKHDGKGYEEINRQVYRVISQFSSLHFAICSFNYPLIKSFQKKYKKYVVGVIIGILANLDHFVNTLNFNSVNFVHYETLDYQKETFLWTVNRLEEAKKIKKLTNQVTIITDRAYALKELLHE